MTVPVYWLSLNPDAICRGYWDNGLIEGLFSGDVWAVPGGPEFEHHELRVTLDDAAAVATELQPGGVVVLGARHHATPEYVTALLRIVGGMRYALLVLSGDEEGAFPAERFIAMPNVRVWVMTPQPGRDYGDAYLIGSGWPPGIRETLRTVTDEESVWRGALWAFMGQVTHERRRACVDMLHERADRDDDYTLVESSGFTLGIDQADYWRYLADTRVALCPSGPISADSMRLYEALEAGCVPLADDRRPANPIQHDYWERLFGAVPFPIVHGAWDTESQTIDWVLSRWPGVQHEVFSWWIRQKRRMAYRLVEDLEAVGACERRLDVAEAAITALIVTSPSPKHPSIDDLDVTVRSITERLPGVEIILVFDGVRPELAHRADQYAEYISRALWAANLRWPNVVPVVLDGWRHQANATREGILEVATRHLLFVEHDTPLTGDIDWAGIVDVLDAGQLDMVRLHHETAIGAHHAHMMLDEHPRWFRADRDPAWRPHGDGVHEGLPVVRTYQWSQRPHVAPRGWYRRILDGHFSESARCMIEDVMHGVVASAWSDYGLAGWSRFRIGMYAPPGDLQRSLHLDSRRLIVGEETTGDSKGSMIFSYPGETPPGAPAPGER